MRKPRDFDAELKALNDKTKALKENKLIRLGELVVATGADALPMETLAGALASVNVASPEQQEAWRKQGGEWFRKGKSGPVGRPRSAAASVAAGVGRRASD